MTVAYSSVSFGDSQDESQCLKNNGDPGSLADACSRALSAWFVSEDTRDKLLAARAYHYLDAGNPGAAVADLNAVLARHSNWSGSFNDRCLAYIKLSQYEDALKDCDRAIALDPGLRFAYRNKARVYESRKDHAAAIRTLSEYLGKFSDDAQAYMQRAASYEAMGDEERARADLQAALQRDPGLQTARAMLARLQAAQAAAATAPSIADPPSAGVVGATLDPALRSQQPVAVGQKQIVAPPQEVGKAAAQAGAAAAQAEQAAQKRKETEQKLATAEQARKAAAMAEQRARAELERQQAAREQAQREQAMAPIEPATRVPPQPEVAPPASAGTSRVALVIGNGRYRYAPRLGNPSNDAMDVASLLTRMGFSVMVGTDLMRGDMEDLMIKFAKAAAKADVAISFYAGHGLQVENVNYLVPVDAAIEDDLDLRRLIRLEDMVRDTGRADSFGLVLVDACRDNPFEAVLARSRGIIAQAAGVSRGLAAPAVPPHMLVTYATAATQTAADGTGRNSPFSTAVLKHLDEAEEVRLVIGKIVDEVAINTHQQQRPDYWGSLGGQRIYLVKPEDSARALEDRLTLIERQAVQRSLGQLGLLSGTEDGKLGPTARKAIRDFQLRLGQSATGYLTVAQMLSLYDEARLAKAPRPLPPINVIDLLRRSEAGDRDAMLLRAKVFDPSYVVGPLPKDASEAVRWYRKAAEAGEPEAALALALRLRDGDGVAADPAESAHWLTIATDAGSADAAYALAELHHDGTRIPRSEAKAIQLFRLAAQRQSAEAITQLRALNAWDVP